MQRAQILFEDSQYRRLKELSQRSGRSVGNLVRDAIDRSYLSSGNVAGGIAKIRSVEEIKIGDWATEKSALREDVYPQKEWSRASRDAA